MRLSELERETLDQAGAGDGGRGAIARGRPHQRQRGQWRATTSARQVEQLVDSNPDRVAQQLRTWMQEELAVGREVPSGHRAGVPGAAPASCLPATAERLPGTRKAAVLMAALGSERAANVLQRLGEDGDREPLDGDGHDSARSARRRPSRSSPSSRPSPRAGTTGQRRHGLRPRGDRARARARAGGGDPRPALGRSARLRPFEFLRRVPARARSPRCCAASPRRRSRSSSPACTTGLAAQVLARLPERQQPDIALRIARMGETSAQVDPAGRGGHAPQADGGRRAGVLRGGRHQGPRRDPQPRRSDDRAQRAREPRHGRQGASAEEVRGMLFVFEDIVKLDERASPAGAARGRPEGPRARAARRARGASRRS